MKVSIYLNVALTTVQGQLAPSIFRPSKVGFFSRGYVDGDPLAPVMNFDIPPTEEQLMGAEYGAAEYAFEVGNIDPEWGGSISELATQYRREQVRSLSVGDVVVVDDEAYACMSMGFEHVGPAADLTILKESAAQVSYQVRWANRHGLNSPLLKSLEAR